MTHNTEQPEALRLADWLDDQYDPDHYKAAAATELRRQHARIAELEAARIAYASEFEPDADGDPNVGNIHANIRARGEAHFAASKAQHEPLDEEAIERVTGVKRGTPMFLAATGFVRSTERAHGITQENQE